MIRKIEVDDDGLIFHAYVINDSEDPHNPEGGLEVSDDEESASFHETLIRNLDEHRKLYAYDNEVGLRKREYSECEEEWKGKYKKAQAVPSHFVKKNLDKQRKFSNKKGLIKQ